MFTPSVSLFSVQWDLRSIWASMDLISKAYFLALLGSTAFIGLSAARILWAIRQSKPERNQNTKADWQRLSIRLHNGFRFFFLLFLVFGVAVANAVFVAYGPFTIPIRRQANIPPWVHSNCRLLFPLSRCPFLSAFTASYGLPRSEFGGRASRKALSELPQADSALGKRV